MRNYKHSHSEVERHAICPFQAVELGKLKINFQTRAMGLGSAMHLGCQHYGQHCQQHNYSTDMSYIPELAAEIADTANLDGDESGELVDLLEKFSDQMVFEESDRFEVELRFDENWNLVPDDKPAWIGGTIDHLRTRDELLMITDYKSDHMIPGNGSPWKKRYERQLKRYAAMALAAFPEAMAADARDHFVRYGRETDPVIVNRGEHEAILEEFAAECRRLEIQKAADPKPGSHCHGCPIVGRCPIYAKLPDQIIVASREDATRYGRQYYLMKSQVSQIEKGLRDFCFREGPVEIDGGRFGWFPRSVSSYPEPKKVLDGLVSNKLLTWDQIWSRLKVAKGVIEDLVRSVTPERSKSRKAANQFCERFLTQETQTVFTFQKDAES